MPISARGSQRPFSGARGQCVLRNAGFGKFLPAYSVYRLETLLLTIPDTINFSPPQNVRLKDPRCVEKPNVMHFSSVALICILLLLVAVQPVGAEEQQSEPGVPLELRVPSGHKLLVRAEAKGVQIYKSVEGKGGKLEWVLEAPLADLFSGEGKKLGFHYEGPSWEAMDGSKVTRDKEQAVQTAAAPNAQEDIPWLLVKVKAEGDEQGIFNQVVYIQRVNTKGGKAPAEAPLRVGTKVGVAYRATYYCYGRAD
jgi:hypothetical protein